MKPDELLAQARERFNLAVDAEAQQRAQEKEDLLFQVPELQWTPEARAQRAGDASTGTPARPILSITQVAAPVRLTRNQARQAKLGVNIHPISEDADEETAEIIQGLYRRIERDSNANTARLWALDRALKCGRGYYRIVTDYDEDAGDDTFDQEIRIERILHQGSVYMDPAATKADWSDVRFAFVAAWMPADEFKRTFPAAKAVTAGSQAEWEAAGYSAPNWVRGDYGKESAFLVAEYLYKDVQTKVLERDGQTRRREIVKVYSVKISGAEVLEEPQLLPGRYIPIVQVSGEELQPFDERRRFNGMITTSKDGQRVYNFAASSLIEGMAIEPKAPFIGYEGQFEGHEAKWQQANVRNFPYLEAKPVTLDGKGPLPLPQRAQVDGTRMSLAMMALDRADRWIQSTTTVGEPSLGRLSNEERSGRAILATQQQTDMATSEYLANLAEVAMHLEGRIILDWLPEVYDSPGRVTRIIRGDDEKSEPIVLGAPFVVKDGRPQAVRPGTQGAKHFDLTKGRYGVNIDVGRSYRTRLQEGDETLSRIVEAAPGLMEILGDIWFRFRDHPGAKEIADRLAKLRESKYPGIGEGEDGQAPPEQLAMRAQALEQQVRQLNQQLQAAAQALQTDQAKQQAQVAKAQLDAQASLEKTRMETESREMIAATQEETKRLIAGMQARMDAFEALMKAAGAEVAHREDMAHEVAMAAAQPQAIPQLDGDNSST